MKRVACILYFTLAASTFYRSYAQQVSTSGQVRDAASGELMSGVIVWDSLSQRGAFTNIYGFFSLTLPGPGLLKFSYVGYSPVYITIDEQHINKALDIRLERSCELEEIIIQANRPRYISGNPVRLPIGEVRSMPTLLGESDVLKAFSFTPGVSTGTEGSAGLYVRGGTPDQNLILLDEVPVYNVMHLGGFFSVFNTASLKSAELYKGSFPARYGGRLSSVIGLSMKEGNNQKFGGEVGLGLLNQSLTLEGPIIKNRASFIVSGRISNLGLSHLLKRKRQTNGFGSDYTYFFYDLNAKINYQLSKTDQLFLSFYSGYDRFKYDDWRVNINKETSTSTGNNWGNATSTLRYSKMMNTRFFLRAALIFSRYTSEFTNDLSDIDQDGNPVKLFRHTQTRVTDFGGKLQLDYFPHRAVEMKLGVEMTRHFFQPFSTLTNYEQDQTKAENEKIMAMQADAFVDTDIKLTKKINLNVGGRFTSYEVNGVTFRNPEPRAGIGWVPDDNWKLTASATVMNQYLHLLVNNGYGFGYDAWLPSIQRVPPSRAEQWSVGLSRSLVGPNLEFSLEYYRKTLSHMIDYPDGTNFTGLLAKPWDDIVSKDGVGRGSGLEIMAERNSGKLKGRLSYTVSRSELRFDEVNEGQWYPMKYDRRHNLNISARYNLTKKLSCNATFIYQTGHAITVPYGAILSEDGSGPRFIYRQRNNGRMPAFHRLDLGLIRSGTFKSKHPTQLGLGIYNVYNRSNPLYVDLVVSGSPLPGKGTIAIKQYSLFPILPFINYSIQF
ncbi:TonB-dependent receptor [Leadbetterella sp. DM7]|uniref:TonB-dependent receptor n=1 Tax=Leadbetterella sp. DM7 TaxID=3235085 RepID=UPI00349E4C73